MEHSEGEYVKEGPREEANHGEATGFINCVTFCSEFRTFQNLPHNLLRVVYIFVVFREICADVRTDGKKAYLDTITHRIKESHKKKSLCAHTGLFKTPMHTNYNFDLF